MHRALNAALITACAIAAVPPSLQAQPAASGQPPAASPSRIAACSLVPKEEVKRHLPWIAVLDRMPIEEEPIGTSGSSCNYPSVFVQILPFSRRTIDALREKGGLEIISGVGDEAYLHNNRDRYAELYVRAGSHLLTLQANVDGSVEAVKPGVINLARAFVAKLR